MPRSDWLRAKTMAAETIIPLALMASESIAHSAFGFMSYWLKAHSGSRKNC